MFIAALARTVVMFAGLAAGLFVGLFALGVVASLV